MHMPKLTVVILICLLNIGCAAGLTASQEREYSRMEAAGVLVNEKNPTTGAWLGLLPGGGSFYARKPGLGILNLLFWPLSWFWDPISGYDGSQVINYDLTMYKLKKDRAKEMSALDDQYFVEAINKEEYLREKKKIEEKYDFD